MNHKIFTDRLLNWYAKKGRKFPWRQSCSPYKILITEKLLQQTSYGHVLRVYENFFQKYPTIEALAEGEVSSIENEIKSLGFQRQRAVQLKNMANAIVNEYHSEIPDYKGSLTKLSGVGEYIADAVLCYAFNNDIVPVDVNIRRVAKRLVGWEETPKDKKIQQEMMKFLPRKNVRKFNWALLDFSALICSRIPKCNKCFATDVCNYYQNIRSLE
ncbi:MAG: hypothetical protein ACFFDT_17975 [Candidatus Hodarchaeota archaeon]